MLVRPPATGVPRLLAPSIAPSTAKAYRAALDRFARWLHGWPVTDTTVAAYVAALMDEGKPRRRSSRPRPKAQPAASGTRRGSAG